MTDLDRHPYPTITVAEAAAYLRVHEHTIYHEIDKGALRAVRVGRVIRIPIDEFRRYVAVPSN